MIRLALLVALACCAGCAATNGGSREGALSGAAPTAAARAGLTASSPPLSTAPAVSAAATVRLTLEVWRCQCFTLGLRANDGAAFGPRYVSTAESHAGYDIVRDTLCAWRTRYARATWTYTFGYDSAYVAEFMPCPAVDRAAAEATLGLREQAATAGAVSVSFRMPLYHDRFPLSGIPDTTSLLPTGYHRWEIGYSSQSKACRDSGLAWCRNPANFGAWRPGAQIVPFRSGYAAPGQYVTVDSILVSSFSWPYALWGRAWTDVPGRWTYITERTGN